MFGLKLRLIPKGTRELTNNHKYEFTMNQLSLFEQFNVDNRTQIEQLRTQLEQLELKASVQETAIGRWKAVLIQAEEALKDIASVFEDSEVLFQANEDIGLMVQNIADKHDEYFMTARIASKDVREKQKGMVTSQLALETAMPSPNDNLTILTQKQIEVILGELNEYELVEFSNKNGINAHTINGIARNLAKRNLTYVGLNMLINMIKPLLTA